MKKEEARKKAEELVAKMTFDEMASQLRYDAPAIERLGIPEYNWWNEGLHGLARSGTATVFPQSIGLGATFDTELMEEIGNCIAVEARARYNESSKHGDRDIYKGLTIWSPNVNLFRDPRWGRGQETYGEDPVHISKMAVPFIKGIQGKSKTMLAAACAKHFAVHSGPEAMRHSFDAKVSKKEMYETYLPAFEACVKEGEVEAVMGAYNRTNGEPCCGHMYLMKEVLRDTWGFQGHYVSDCWAIRDFHENHMVTKTPERSVKLALEAGCDVNCGCTYQKIISAKKKGLIDDNLVKTACIRLFTTRFMLGMFEENEWDGLGFKDIDTKEHRALADRAALESVVLLKNDNILPLDKSKYKSIAVIGPNADSRAALIGNYHGTPSRHVTVLEGIIDEAGEDISVHYAKGAHLFKDREENLAKANDRVTEAVIAAENTDLTILCLGLDETLEGEEGDTGNSYASGDKTTLDFPESQRVLFEAVVATGKPVILLVMTGSAMDLRYANEHCNAVLQTWYPGGMGGKSIAQILFGKESPSGKLPVTIYNQLEDLPDFTDYSMKGRTYRFIEDDSKVLFPFGFGLNYSKSVVKEAKLVKDFADSDTAEVQVTIANEGDHELKDVLQLYVKTTDSELEVPNPHLADFMRIELKKGETKTVSFNINKSSFTVVNEEGERVYDGHKGQIFVGFAGPDSRSEELTGQKAHEIAIEL
ncbi:MAG: glycoside hydrolase family 3 C-terminal domain-containing protein [Butyrivibrio sp.]|nr:glycoside hydrolase family 3 C-terminal domain-containing protein [Butyrivibrio sp.]